jgi:hypothetical protein
MKDSHDIRYSDRSVRRFPTEPISVKDWVITILILIVPVLNIYLRDKVAAM